MKWIWLRNSSHLEARELVYINQHIDKLLHITSLYLTSPATCNTQLQQLLSLCTPHSFFCSLCNFAVNVTQSCQQSKWRLNWYVGIYLVSIGPVNLSSNLFQIPRLKYNMKYCSRLTFWLRFFLLFFLIIQSHLNHLHILCSLRE